MYLREEEWEAAYQALFDAFKLFDEAGSPRKISCLKLLVLASMLMKSSVSPFAAQEVCPTCCN